MAGEHDYEGFSLNEFAGYTYSFLLLNGASVCHFLNKFRTSDTCKPACDLKDFFKQHMCGTLELFRYSSGR